ncbi:hypothetical protein [Sphingobacterium composti Ten et al. 2007 non Yoo et al. 2007]|uniref:hypothetical protein n=1 Tax=Sphingobacterium composti TaxID=363260 RepID=UPI0013586E4D|nr:hypothetical protein [Sphingobacterium composti Ten et al. 2007 non Yoo et al. 2007]
MKEIENKETGKKTGEKMQNNMLLEEIMSSSNLHQAYDQVVGNKGAPGTDKVGHGVATFEWRQI